MKNKFWSGSRCSFQYHWAQNCVCKRRRKKGNKEGMTGKILCNWEVLVQLNQLERFHPLQPFLTEKESSCHERYRERRELQGRLNSTLIPNRKNVFYFTYMVHPFNHCFFHFSLYVHQCRVVYLKAVVLISTVSWENREKSLPRFCLVNSMNST